MKFAIILIGVATAAVVNRDTDYYEYDDINESIKVEDIALGPVDAKAMLSQDTVRVPVSQLRNLLDMAMREYKRHDRNRSYMRSTRGKYRRQFRLPSGAPYRDVQRDY